MKYFSIMLYLFCNVCSFAATPAPSPTPSYLPVVDHLGMKIGAINKQKKGPKTNLKKIESDYLALINENKKPEDIGRLYAELGNVYIQTGVSEPQKAAAYLKKALDYPLDPTIKIRVFTDLGQALERQSRGARGEELAAARRKIVEPILQAIKYANDQDVPYEKIPFPKSALGGTMHHYAGPDKEKVDMQIKQETEEMFRVRKVNRMVEEKIVAEHLVVRLYTKKPFATEELNQIAWDILKDHTAVDRLVNQVKKSIGVQMKNDGAGNLKKSIQSNKKAS